MALVISMIYISGATAVRGTRNLFRHEKIILEYRIRRIIGAFLMVFIGYTVHFLGDLPTPPGPWGGINLFWPSKEMSGGWGLIWWHNWYIIYLAIRFMIMFSVVALVAGILSSIPFRFVRWSGYGVRGVTVIIALVFAWQTYSFISSHSCKEMGFDKWDKLNRSLVPQKYIKNADKYLASLSGLTE